MEKEKVVIIGAGIAGLVAARELSPHCEVVIVEAQERAGGRIHTTMEAGIVVERGAEFIHGRLANTFALVLEAGLTAVPAKGKMYRSHKGQLREETEMTEHWDLLMARMKQTSQDMTLASFLETRFPEDQYAGLRAQAINFAEGFDLADPERAGIHALYREWSADEDQNFRLQEGYGALIDFLVRECTAAGCELITGDAATGIRWGPGRVEVSSASGKTITGTKLVITIPVSLLATGAEPTLRFTPGIIACTDAAAEIGMGKVVRMVLGFSKSFWPADTGFIFSDEKIPTWWSGLQGPVHLLTGWAGGSKAAAFSTSGENEIVSTGIGSLAAIFGKPIDELKEALVFGVATDWWRNRWSAGGYSYATPSSQHARKLLNEPVAMTIWFAGEGIAGGDHPGTVEAAITHALDVAAQLKRQLHAK